MVKRLILVKSKLRGIFLQILWPSQNILTLKGKSYCDRYFDANTEYDPTAVIKMKSKRLSKFLGPSFSYLTAWDLQPTMIARMIVVEQQRTITNGASRNPCHSFDASSCPPQFWNFRQSLMSSSKIILEITLYNYIIITSLHYIYIIQGVPPICWQLRTKFWKLKNHICQKVTPDLKSLGKKLLDGTLKPRKIKLEVFLKWI